MKRTLNGFLFIALNLFFSTSHAAVISAYGDYQWDDSTNYVSNTTSGTEWFRWNTQATATRTEWQNLYSSCIGLCSVSANQILNIVNTGESASTQWRFANLDDVSTLFSDFFGTITFNERKYVNPESSRGFVQVFGESYGWQSLFLKDSTDELNGAASVVSIGTSVGPLNSAAYSNYDHPVNIDAEFGFSIASSYRVALVRTKATEASEPATMALLLFGLAGLILVRNRVRQI